MSKGIDIRQSGSALLIRALLLDADGEKITSGTASLRLWELQSDGTLHTFDFDDNTFKSGAVTTESASLTHRQAENSTYDTGVWTYAQTSVGGFTAGSVIIAEVHHADASPPTQTREIQYGGAEGDIALTAGNVHADVQAIDGDTDAAGNLAAVANRHGTAVFVGHDGNNATSGTALKAAVEGASTGTTVFVGPGVFDLGTDHIDLPDRVSLIGVGRGVTRIVSAVTISPAQKGVINLGADTRVADLTVTSTEDELIATACRLHATDDRDFGLVRVERVTMEGHSDALMVEGTQATGRLRLADCHLHAKWDGIAMLTDHLVLDLHDCVVEAIGPHPDTGNRDARAIFMVGGVVRIAGGVYRASGSVSGHDAAISCHQLFPAIPGRVEIRDALLAGALYDVYADEVTSPSITVARTAFDAAKVSGTTITQIDTPGNVTGKVLGGGSATITGVGARAVDHAGNNLAPASTALSNAVWTNAKAATIPTSGTILTTLGSNAPAGWINANAIAASALDGKGDWLLSSSYTAPDNAGIAEASAQATAAASQTTATAIRGAVGLVSDNLDAQLSDAQASADAAHSAAQAAATDAAAIKLKTDNLPDEPASKTDVQVTVEGGGGTGTGDLPTVPPAITRDGVGVDNCIIRVYLASDYAMGNFEVRGEAVTGPDGRVVAPLMLNAGSYKAVVWDAQSRRSQVFDLEVSE